MSDGIRQTTEYYLAAIDGLHRYAASEPDDEKCEAAEAKISEYRLKIIEANFDDIVQRTDRLQTLMQDLQAVIANATRGGTVAGAIGNLTQIVSQAASAVAGSSAGTGDSAAGKQA